MRLVDKTYIEMTEEERKALADLLNIAMNEHSELKDNWLNIGFSISGVTTGKEITPNSFDGMGFTIVVNNNILMVKQIMVKRE